MKYVFCRPISHGYIILGDGNIMFPEDVVKELSTLARVTAELDIEHRRRVAAERYLKSIEYIHGNTPLQESHRDEWQSIIKEVGE